VIPASEQEFSRQRELDTYRIVDSLPEEAYEDIVRLASLVCGAPTALISFIDRDRQWFKARTGFDCAQSARDEAFCDHAIRTPDRLMEVPDARLDARFESNPLVTGDSRVRFYAGMPLTTPSGAAIGTVCVLDRQPRRLDDGQRAALAALARLTMNLLEGRHRERALQRAALLAEAPAAPVLAAGDVGYCTLLIVQAQALAACAERLGERAVERTLQSLDSLLEAALVPGYGDHVSRVAGSGELIAALHGRDTQARLQAMVQVLPAFERTHGIRLLHAAAHADRPDERVEQIYLRADESLSRLKDALAAS